MLKYETLVKDAINEIPEFASEYRKQYKPGWLDEDTGKHIVFSLVFVPLLADAIRNGKTGVRDRMLSFLENMASSEDGLVQEVCDFTVLEELYGMIPSKKLYPLLGKHTKEGYLAISQYMLPN